MIIPEKPPKRDETRCAGTALSIPDVTGLSNCEAALAYAECGAYVLPVREWTKHPGSVVGNAWQNQSSDDPEQIRAWWRQNPYFGIAIHVGRSGAGVFDFDGDDLRIMIANGHGDMMDALKSAGAIQHTRRSGDRGHYLWLLPDDGRDYGNSAGVFGQYGEFRGKNGVIIVAPTQHPDAIKPKRPDEPVNQDAVYQWAKVGRLLVMPEVLRLCLSAASDNTRAELLDGEINAWVAAQPGAVLELAELAELPPREWLSEYATVEAVRALLVQKANGGSIFEAARNMAKHMVFSAAEGRKGLTLALNNLWDAYVNGIMADRRAGLLAGDVRPVAAAEAELARAIRGAVALAVARSERYDTDGWQARLADATEAAPKPSYRPKYRPAYRRAYQPAYRPTRGR